MAWRLPAHLLLAKRQRAGLPRLDCQGSGELAERIVETLRSSARASDGQIVGFLDNGGLGSHRRCATPWHGLAGTPHKWRSSMPYGEV